jgi:hypothetical protein
MGKRYPYSPGWQDNPSKTSQRAAEEMAGKAPTLREQAYELIRNSHRGLTPDQVAEAIGKSPFSIRPRVCELHKQGWVYETGEVRFNPSGKRAAVYRATVGQLRLL